jgi:hypothetical protein
MKERKEERVEAGYKLIASLYTGTKKKNRERQVDYISIVKNYYIYWQ